MVNVYILESDKYRDKARCAFHYTVPGGTNNAGKTWVEIAQTLTAQRVATGILLTQVPWLLQAVQDDLTAGNLWEEVVIVDFNANLSDAEKVTIIDAKYAEKEAEWQAKYQNLYRYWGTERTV